MMEEKQLAVVPEANNIARQVEGPLSVEGVVHNVALVKDILDRVMQENLHYGKIPGCPKPSLWQPGAEVLDLAFRLRPSYERLSVEYNPAEGLYRVEIKCRIKTIGTGLVVGEAIAECSSLEDAFKKTMSKPGKSVEDVRNAVSAKAQKRAHVRATRGATAASEIFDFELDEEGKASPKGRGGPPKGADPKESDAQLNSFSKGLNACNSAEELKKYWTTIQLSPDWRKLTSEDVEELGNRKDVQKQQLEGRLL